MPKVMQKVVLFIEPSDDAFMTPEKIGQLFMNRIAVDEDASFKILDTYKIEKNIAQNFSAESS